MEIFSGIDLQQITETELLPIDLISVITTSQDIINRAVESAISVGTIKVKRGQVELTMPVEQLNDMTDKEVVIYANPPYETPENAERLTLKLGTTDHGYPELIFGIVPNKIKGQPKSRIASKKFSLRREEGMIKPITEGLSSDEINSHVNKVLNCLATVEISQLHVGIYQKL